MRIVASATVLAVFASVPVTAETVHELKPGDLLYVEMEGTAERCVLDSLDIDTLYVKQQKDNEARQIVKSHVRKIQVRVPRSPGRGALRGALIGAAAGSVAGVLIAVTNPEEEAEACGEFEPLCQGGLSFFKAFGYAGVFGMAGAAAGAAIGAVVPGTSWQTVDLRRTLSLRMDTDGTVHLQYSRAF